MGAGLHHQNVGGRVWSTALENPNKAYTNTAERSAKRAKEERTLRQPKKAAEGASISDDRLAVLIAVTMEEIRLKNI